MAIHIIEDVGELVFVLGVASQGHMKRDCPLNVSRPTYGVTALSSVAAPTHIIGSVAQPMGSRTSSRGAQSGMRGQTAGVEDKPGPLC